MCSDSWTNEENLYKKNILFWKPFNIRITKFLVVASFYYKKINDDWG